MANEAVLDWLADAYQQGFSRIQIAAEAAAQDAWLNFDSFAGDDEDAWAEAFWAIILAAALMGWLGSKWSPTQFPAGKGHGAAGDSEPVVTLPPATRASLPRSLKIIATCLTLWYWRWG